MNKENLCLKKGNFTQVPNEMLEFLMEQNLTGLEFRLCFFLIRNLVGWNYAVKPVSITEFSMGVNHDDEKQIIKAIGNLVKKKILIKIKVKGYRSPCYGFDKKQIARVLIGEERKLYLDGSKVIDLKTFKLLKVRNLTPSECQSLHPEGVENDTFKTQEGMTVADTQLPKYSQIPINTNLKKGKFENFTEEAAGEEEYVPCPPEIREQLSKLKFHSMPR